MKKVLDYKHRKKVTVIAALLFFTLFIPTPYLLYQPGTIENLSSKVTVESGQKKERGSLNLTTVFTSDASNIYYLAYGLIDQDTVIKKKRDVTGNLSNSEYNLLLKHMMESSKVNAIAAAFNAAGEKVETDYKGIFITNVLATSKAKGIIHVGDLIYAVDGHVVHTADEFINYMKEKQAGDKVDISFSSNGVKKEKKIEVIRLKTSNNKVGLGIMPEDELAVNVARSVTINTEDIGGPSAGLMLSLEIYDQLKDDDLTKGFKVAGTGTIDIHGNVGQIGGIRQKIVAAHNAGVNIFFCPKDINNGDMNEKDIKDEANKRGYNIKIVPVRTMSEAIAYLKRLPQK